MPQNKGTHLSFFLSPRLRPRGPGRQQFPINGTGHLPLITTLSLSGNCFVFSTVFSQLTSCPGQWRHCQQQTQERVQGNCFRCDLGEPLRLVNSNLIFDYEAASELTSYNKTDHRYRIQLNLPMLIVRKESVCIEKRTKGTHQVKGSDELGMWLQLSQTGKQ